MFDCKPLQFLWAKFPDRYGPDNTIMLDDLRRSEKAAGAGQGMLSTASQLQSLFQPSNNSPHSPPISWHADYVLNPQQGLVIRPYRKAHLRRGTDRELLYLSAYLSKIARLDSLAELNHGCGCRHRPPGASRPGSPAVLWHSADPRPLPRMQALGALRKSGDTRAVQAGRRGRG